MRAFMKKLAHRVRVLRRRITAEMLIAWSALFVSTTAVVISFWQTRLLNTQARTSVWPRLTHSVNIDIAARSFELSLSNKGIGPLDIRWMALEWDGRPMSSWIEFVKLNVENSGDTGDGPQREATAYFSSVDVLRAGETDVLLRTSGALAPRLARLLTSEERLRWTICYCSALDDCWRFETTTMLESARKQVSSCRDTPAVTLETVENDAFLAMIDELEAATSSTSVRSN